MDVKGYRIRKFSKQKGIHLLLSTIITLINKRLVTTRGGDARICVSGIPRAWLERSLVCDRIVPRGLDSWIYVSRNETNCASVCFLLSNEVEVSPSSSGLSTIAFYMRWTTKSRKGSQIGPAFLPSWDLGIPPVLRYKNDLTYIVSFFFRARLHGMQQAGQCVCFEVRAPFYCLSWYHCPIHC